MNGKTNRRKRYILTGVLLAAAALFGIEHCINDEPEQEQSTDQQTGSGIPSPGGMSQESSTPDVTSMQQDAGQSVSVYNKVGRSVRHLTNTKSSRRVLNTAKGRHGRISLSDQPDLSLSSSAALPDRTTDAVSRKGGKHEPDQQPTAQKGDNLVNDKNGNSYAAMMEEGTKGAPSIRIYSFPHRHQFRIGLRAGAGYSFITGTGSIIESHNVRPTFTMSEHGGTAPRLGIFGTWQYRRSGVELGIDYTRISSKLTEHKIPENVTETTRFHYNFLVPQLLFRFHALPRFYMGAGISAAIPFGSRNIDFTNDRSGEVYRQQAERTQDHLREAVKARVTFIPIVRVGYVDTKNGLEAGLEYGFGFNDMLRTLANDYGYQERTNNLQTVSLTIGYSLPLNKVR